MNDDIHPEASNLHKGLIILDQSEMSHESFEIIEILSPNFKCELTEHSGCFILKVCVDFKWTGLIPYVTFTKVLDLE